MSNIFKTTTIRIEEGDFNNLPDYSIYHPPFPQVGERWKRNVHPKYTLMDRQRLGPKISYEWWIAEVVKPQDAENENYDIIWSRAEVIPLVAYAKAQE